MKRSLLLLSSSLALLAACNMPEKPEETPKEESTPANKKVGLANNRTNTNAFPKSVSSDADRRIAQDVQKAIAGQKNIIIKFAVDAAENPAVMRQQMMNFLNIMFTLPPEAIEFHWKALDKTYGMFFHGHSLKELYQPPVMQEDLLTPEQERDVILGEQGVVAQRGQNHELHIQYHEQEMASMKFALSPVQFELYKALIMSHYQLLMQQMAEQQMMMQQQMMQMQGQGGEGGGKADKRQPNMGPHTASPAPSTGSLRQGLGG